MVLRCDSGVPGGGYDEGLERAQDYDLWLRLRPRIGACPQVLYRYTERAEPGIAASSEAQALAAARAMIAAWTGLPACSPEQREQLASIVAAAKREDHGGDVLERVLSLLAGRESREGLMALLWARDRFPPLRHRAVETGRRARVREVCARIAAAGATRVWLWGAGQHTRRLLEHAEDLGLPPAGVADDAACGQSRFGFGIIHPREVPAGEHLLISTDVHEERMWEASATLRARGVRVWRLYAGP
jgi:hypothetical protein